MDIFRITVIVQLVWFLITSPGWARYAGRDEPHPVRPRPASYSLSPDVMGPFKEGSDQAIKGAKYAMIGVYTIPIGEGAPLPEGLSALSKGRRGLMTWMRGRM